MQACTATTNRICEWCHDGIAPEGTTCPPRPYVWQSYLSGISSDWLRIRLSSRQRLVCQILTLSPKISWRGVPTEPGFVSIGEAAGESLPAGYRRYDKGCGHSDNECNQNEDSDELRGYYHWGDSVSFQGYYFATLATEYAMFQQLGFDTTETLNDLTKR